MKIGIIVAMRKELDLLLPQIEEVEEKEHKGVPVWRGRIGDHEVCALQCGIGKVNSALAASALIDDLSPDLVINTGVAGGADVSIDINHLLVADSVCYHDVWCGPGTEYGAAADLPVKLRPDSEMLSRARNLLADRKDIHFGLICSGDKFISKPEEIADIKSHFPDALAVDMESASIAQVCAQRGVPFMIVRAISDTPGSGRNIAEYEDFWTAAPRETFAVLRSLLSAL